MASEVMTFDSIVSKVRHEIDDNEGGFLNLTGDRVKEVLDELESAHKSEVAAMNEVIDANLRVHKAVERYDADKKLELNGEIVRRDICIADLRECMKEAIDVACARCNMANGTNCDGENVTFKSCLPIKWRKAMED